MKYYYNGELIRTSKNHIYTHAVINIQTMRVLGCRGSLANAEALLTTERNIIVREIENLKNKLKSFKDGKSKYGWKYGNKTWYESFKSTDTEERIMEAIKHSEEYLEVFKETYKVVELEAK